MELTRPIVLSVAGFDPSAGAGLLADIKTLEQHKVYGLGICTAITLQTESNFLSLKWEPVAEILAGIEKMLLHYNVSVVKIGIVESPDVLNLVVDKILLLNPLTKIIVDPVFRSTTGFEFYKKESVGYNWESLLEKLFLITPNFEEISMMFPLLNSQDAAFYVSSFCNVLLKGGHNPDEPGVDYLFTANEKIRLEPGSMNVYAKHGSGCVLSSSIAANIALGMDLSTACYKGKEYTALFLSSNETLTGFHHV